MGRTVRIISLIILSCLFFVDASPSRAVDGPPPSLILYNAKIHTMEDSQSSAEAIFVVGDKIAAIGDSNTILRIRKPNTRIIDMEGKVVFPGFIDPHTHLFNEYKPYYSFSSFDNAQKLAIERGITSFGNMFVDQSWLNLILNYAYSGNMRNRLFLYLNYNGSCGPVFGTWYEKYVPRVEHAPHVWVNGVKLFAEKSVCGNDRARLVFSDALKQYLGANSYYRQSQLLFSVEQLAPVIRRANDYGYQVAIHAMGDLGVETSLSAIQAALDGGANVNRNMVLHNSFIRDDMLTMYKDSDIVALIEPDSRSELNAYLDGVSVIREIGEENVKYFKRWRDLVDTGIHVALDSDWPFFGTRIVSPISKMYTMVTGVDQIEVYFPMPSEPPFTNGRLTVDECIRMMTIEAAYAMRMEKKLGSIKPGKFADLVVLSADPYTVAPIGIKDIQVLMTIIGGKIEYDVREQ